jgi:hypothetical protein
MQNSTTITGMCKQTRDRNNTYLLILQPEQRILASDASQMPLKLL